ncbi:histidine kinase [Clostridium cochlearium]|jgi:LytS/YehU family sensor histidine kinase|uniref:sensor histidine kinase n=1 Tax=Clostridium cochlearium TaxID=1494 RepID=UPI000BBCB330|nr:PocR ligand-binding domain-containing protein [Clostridium cochlearium]MBV1818978.1 PocR ligand-binding domain-containing protein [Bacteroidales bacterium MSK.15.36]NSJ91208.1 histidine kinase [Coprococcus sp. MSK.21.13]MBE6064078.1 histidine kinase [Clostridium cochlearium]MCG4572126.1 PocR ligand-binding domain-containing protein [Clostridium cochlearium]MCG4580572.1 PocR ligand-binding domain-containing protein [Clostridium cochlearium]
MPIFKHYDFEEIIDIEFLQSIQDKFANILGIPTTTVDEKGNPIVNSSKFSDFCTLIRSSEEGRRRCALCDAKGGFDAMRKGKPIIYFCHSGLTDLAAPIIVDNNYIGCMLCGQVIVEELNNKKHMNLDKLSRDINIPKDKLEHALEKTSVWKYEDIIETADFLFLFSNFIAKIGVSNINSHKLLEQTKEKAKLEKLLKNTKIKALQSQINPHFLFNTLNTVARMALLENAPKTEQLIYALSDILRYSIKNSEDMVPLKTEINNIRKYLYIQHERFGNRINYDIQVDTNILNCKIPVMTLQPLVENSIIHGLEGKKEGGYVLIKGRSLMERYIAIDIIDDGIGIEEDKLKVINSTINEDNSLELGISNVRDRLIYYFGHACKFTVNSILNQGTKITIEIPIIK